MGPKIPFHVSSISIFFGLALFLAGCGGPPSGHGGGMVVPVVAEKIEAQPLRETVALVGTLMANESIEIKNEIDGTIDSIEFDEGSRVDKGDILFRIDEKKLKAALNEARANLELSRTNLKRYENLIQKQAVSQIIYDNALTEFEIDQAAFIRAQENLNDAIIRSPFDGTVGARSVSAGQFIAKGTMLSTLADIGTMKLEAQIPERYFSKIAKNQKISIKVAAYPGEIFEGTVYFIDPQVNPNTRTLLLKAYVENPESKLKQGMFANVELIIRETPDALIVPESAVVFQEKAVIVYVVGEDNTVSPQTVTTGIRTKGGVEVTSGIHPGDTLVIEGTQKMRPGAKVSFQPDDRQSKVNNKDGK